MNYTNTIRNFCYMHTGELYDVAFMHREFFPMIPEGTYLKTLKRLCDTGTLLPVSKGVYFISCDTDGAPDIDAAIRHYYIDSFESGIYKGTTLYHYLGLVERAPSIKEAYTNILPSGAHKTVRDYKLTGATMYFTDEAKSLITTLELIEQKDKFGIDDYCKYDLLRRASLQAYSDTILCKILSAIPYQYSTVTELDRMLNDARIAHDCVNMYHHLQY